MSMTYQIDPSTLDKKIIRMERWAARLKYQQWLFNQELKLLKIAQQGLPKLSRSSKIEQLELDYG